MGKNYAFRKRRRKQSIVGPAVDKGVAHEAVGLKPAALVPKEVPMIKKKSSVLQVQCFNHDHFCFLFVIFTHEY